MTDKMTAAAPAERRHLPRHRVLKGALVAFGNLTRTYECQVRNLTDEGARLMLTSTLGVPTEFHLLIPTDSRMAPARVMWRTEHEIGVAFTGPWRAQKLVV